MSEGVVVTLPNTPKVLAISFANDEEAKELLMLSEPPECWTRWSYLKRWFPQYSN